MSRVATSVLLALLFSLDIGVDAQPASRPATQPIPVHMLVPGFTVRELPVQVTNLNNVEYGPDGRLYAVGYDGRVHVLVDTDGDGLEDTVKPWCYDHAADMRAPVGMVIRPEGIYISSKGRVSLLRDTTGSGVADHYEMVVGGWKEIKNNVDALGVAVDKDGNLYYGRGAEDYRNPLLTDKAGVPHYDLKSETGTVIQVSPDRSKREIIATGIRFTVALAINREGDLFATDQEGATWVPGGNPLDKITQIIAGRHYGFPPKSLNPQYLKDIVDEPNVVSFGPQHQSSCGMKFNEKTAARRSFGPDFWEGDALVAGESRGKLWRCPLVKTAAGYVGKPIIIASLDVLTLDVAISPMGDLVVCTHSGNPDWGTGPKGVGRVFKVSYMGRNEPQPVIAWAANREEIRVAFDKPLDPFVLTTTKVIEGGRYVRAADRMEHMRPGYVAVKQQQQTPTVLVKVVRQDLLDEGRTLVLKTEPLPCNAMYSLAMPGVKAAGEKGSGTTVDVDFGLNGVHAQWFAKGADWTWHPHFSSRVSRQWAGLAGDHDGLLQPQPRDSLGLGIKLGQRVFMHAALDLPGKIRVVRIKSSQAFDATIGNREKEAVKDGSGYAAELSYAEPRPVELLIHLGDTPPGFSLDLSYHTDEDPHERAIPFDRLILPWAKDLPPAPEAPVEHKKIGDWARGKALFQGEAQCYTCHSVRGEGCNVGPDLSNLTFKSPESVLNDIIAPNAMINPDYVSYVVKLTSGESITGLVAAEGEDRFRVTEGVNKTAVLRRDEVQSMTPSATSLMPEGFKALGDEKLNDLLEFLTGERPKN